MVIPAADVFEQHVHARDVFIESVRDQCLHHPADRAVREDLAESPAAQLEHLYDPASLATVLAQPRNRVTRLVGWRWRTLHHALFWGKNS